MLKHPNDTNIRYMGTIYISCLIWNNENVGIIRDTTRIIARGIKNIKTSNDDEAYFLEFITPIRNKIPVIIEIKITEKVNNNLFNMSSFAGGRVDKSTPNSAIFVIPGLPYNVLVSAVSISEKNALPITGIETIPKIKRATSNFLSSVISFLYFLYSMNNAYNPSTNTNINHRKLE